MEAGRTDAATLAVSAAATRPAPEAPRPRRLGTGFRTPLSHRLGEALLAVLASCAIAAIALVFLFVAKEALPLLWEQTTGHAVGLADLLLPKVWPGYADARLVWQPVGEPAKYNVVPLFVGTLKITALSMLVSAPIGIASAVYVSQYAGKRTREVLKPLVELLAGVPSVVLGFFALVLLASWVKDVLGTTYRLNALVAAIALSAAVVPVVFTISEDALRAVPRQLEEAALALGARRWQVTLRVVVPAAIPGIAASVVLGLGRAIGETMVVLMASGNAAVVELFDPTSSARTVTATIAAELGEVAQGDVHWRVLFLLGAMLFAITFVLNRLGDVAVRRLHRKLTAETAP